MGMRKFIWSPIRPRLANQNMIYPIIRLEDVEVDIDGVKALASFEVIQVMDKEDPYPNLGTNWAFDNNVNLNLKHRNMYFEIEATRVVSPLDPIEV